MIHFVIKQKLTHHCKAIILQYTERKKGSKELRKEGKEGRKEGRKKERKKEKKKERKKWGTQKGFCAQEPHNVLLGINLWEGLMF